MLFTHKSSLSSLQVVNEFLVSNSFWGLLLGTSRPSFVLPQLSFVQLCLNQNHTIAYLCEQILLAVRRHKIRNYQLRSHHETENIEGLEAYRAQQIAAYL